MKSMKAGAATLGAVTLAAPASVSAQEGSAICAIEQAIAKLLQAGRSVFEI